MRDYFAYYPLTAEASVWGVGVTSTGFLHAKPRSAYPPDDSRHPPDHLFTWDRGRVLRAWQILHIHEGSGEFESHLTGRFRIRAGTTILLFPGVWHRYRPSPTTGWTESWVELEGAIMERLMASAQIDPSQSVFPPKRPPMFLPTLNEIHRLARHPAKGFAAVLSASSLQLLAMLVQPIATPSPPQSASLALVQRARSLIEARGGDSLAIRKLARELGVAESHFRRTFKAHIGLSPKRYHRAIRLRKVQALLQSTPLTISEIAAQTGFYSAFHLSSEFKAETGHSPSAWRQLAWNGHPNDPQKNRAGGI